MKKATFFAAAMLIGVTVAASPLQAMAASTQQTSVKSICVGNAANINADALKEYLQNCNWGNVNVITIPCLPGTPDAEMPEIPEVDVPEVEQPEAPEVDVPEAEQPEAPEVDVPQNPDTNNPGTNTPDTEQPDDGNSDQSVHAYVLRIVELVNEERAKAGLNALTLKEDITAAAQVRAIESEILFSHTRPDGTSFATALKEAGVSYRGAGENIAWGQKSPEEVMQGWMNSAGHRANILNEKYTSIGVGYYQNASGVNYWSQLFTY